ncbi:hypothetical protein WA026_007614 [Henosepilachna vigintioctopunctata]|uniref:Uncharacterized protein n=1 Tax=Henosepilachna vigintioctopunctata TaxID=420089 RepID=A0AAW1UVC8_9CUCU
MTDRFGQPITQYDRVEFLTNAFNRCSNLQKAASGFRSSEIYPLRHIEFDSIGPNISQNNAKTTMNLQQTIVTNTQLSNNQAIEVQQVSNADTTAVTQVHSVEDFNVQASDSGLANSQSENTSTHEVHLSDIVELPVIPPKLEEEEKRKRAKAEESKEKPNRGSQIKSLKWSDKKSLNEEIERVLKNFKNMKEFDDH